MPGVTKAVSRTPVPALYALLIMRIGMIGLSVVDFEPLIGSGSRSEGVACEAGSAPDRGNHPALDGRPWFQTFPNTTNP